MGEAEEHGCSDDADLRREQAPEEDLLADAREAGDQEDLPVGEIARDGAELGVEVLCPCEAAHGDAREADDGERRREPQHRARREGDA